MCIRDRSGPGATKLMSLTKMGLLDENNADRIFNGDELYSKSWSADTVKSGTMLNIQMCIRDRSYPVL